MSEQTVVRHRITILDTNEAFMCSGQQHLLRGMLSLGKKGIPSGCHGGGCGVCKIQIVSGQVDTLPVSREHVSIDEENRGVTLACRSFPKTDVSLKVVGKLSKNVLRTQAPKKYGFI
jgi:Na+-transporting NADH:ubiquinone oxidoreductase subunit NqrF